MSNRNKAVATESITKDAAAQPSDQVLEQFVAEIADDWFWRPVKRHQTEFVLQQAPAAAWRQFGRTSLFARRMSSPTANGQDWRTFLFTRAAYRKK